jgi:hypothetical protein
MVNDCAALPNWTALSQPRDMVSFGQRVKQDRSTEMGKCFFERPDVALDSLISRLRPQQSGSDVVEDQLGPALGLRLWSSMARAEPWLFAGCMATGQEVHIVHIMQMIPHGQQLDRQKSTLYCKQRETGCPAT